MTSVLLLQHYLSVYWSFQGSELFITSLLAYGDGYPAINYPLTIPSLNKEVINMKEFMENIRAQVAQILLASVNFAS